MDEEEGIWELLERKDLLWGLKALLETLRRSVKGLGEVWSFIGKVLGMGVGVEDAGRSVNTERTGGSQKGRLPGAQCCSKREGESVLGRASGLDLHRGPGGSEMEAEESSKTLRAEVGFKNSQKTQTWREEEVRREGQRERESGKCCRTGGTEGWAEGFGATGGGQGKPEAVFPESETLKAKKGGPRRV